MKGKRESKSGHTEGQRCQNVIATGYSATMLLRIARILQQ